MNELLAFAKHIFEQSYTVKVDDISDEMIALGEQTIKDLVAGQDHMSVAEFNNKLKAALYCHSKTNGQTLSASCEAQTGFRGHLGRRGRICSTSWFPQVRENRMDHKDEKQSWMPMVLKCAR